MADTFLILNFNDSTEIEVAKRAERLTRRTPPTSIGDIGTSVQFLRGVGSRATYALSSFYLLISADIEGKNHCTIAGHAGKVFQSQVRFSSLNTIALACRKAFDHGKGLTGATFGRVSDSTWRSMQSTGLNTRLTAKAMHIRPSFFSVLSSRRTLRNRKPCSKMGQRLAAELGSSNSMLTVPLHTCLLNLTSSILST